MSVRELRRNAPKFSGWHPTWKAYRHLSWVVAQFPATRCKNSAATEATCCILFDAGKAKWKSRLIRVLPRLGTMTLRRVLTSMLLACGYLVAQTATYSFSNPLELGCCSPLTYGFTSLIHDATITGQDLQVASITLTATATVTTPDPYGDAGFDWIVSIGSQPFGSPAGQESGGNPAGITNTAPTQLHTAQASSATAGTTLTFKTTYNFRSATLTSNPAGHIVADSAPVMNLSSGLYIQVFAWTGDTNAVLTLSNIQAVVTLAPPLISTTTTVQTSVNPATLGHAVTLSSTVSPAAATGEVTFYDGLSIVGAAKLTAGTAALTTTLLPEGTGSLHATYGGNATYGGSSSQAISETVMALPEDGFESGVNYPFGVSPIGIVVADFNDDGHADLATADFYGGVGVLLGNGDGTFQPAVSYAAGPNSQGIVAGDFNGDGHADLAVSNGYGFLFIITVLLGNGDGTFQPGVTYMTGQGPSSMAVGDFNGDGIADLAVSNNLNSDVSILLGQSNGTLQSPVDYVVGATSGAFGTAPGSIAVGDFNGDGRPDLIVACGGGLSILFGNGDGTFQAAVNQTGPTGTLFVADFNGDGRADLAISSPVPSVWPPVSDTLVMLGNGDGTFKSPVTYPLAVVAVGDFDGNGKQDLLGESGVFNYATGVTAGSISVMFGNGDGTFQTSPAAYAVGLEPNSFAVGDFNGDGRTDLALTLFESTSSTTLTSYVSVMLGIPSATVPSVFGPAITAGGVLNAASFAKNAQGFGAAVAPGSLVQIYGSFPGAMTAGAGTAPYPTSLGGVTVLFNGTAAPLSQVSPAGQYPFVNAQVPFEVQTTRSATMSAAVTVNGTASSSQSVQIVPAAPGIFTIPPNGTGNAVLVFTDPADNVVKIAAPAGASIGYPTAPVPRGQGAFFYVTGLGAMTPPVADGDGGLEDPVVAHYANATPVVMVGGITAEVQFAGQAPGYPGVNQINVVIPENAPTGDQVPIQVISADGSVNSNTATIAIR